MSNEILVLGPDDIFESGINNIKEKELPTIISSQITKLNELDQSVKKAVDAADKAKDSANTAKSKSAGIFKKKEAIEELQSAGLNLAEAVQFGAEAQKISFEFQTKLAEITKYLFGLGVSNIASNRFVVRELEMKLKGASQEQLSELARQELLSVVKQLKDQEDILRKQENLSKHVKTHEEMLKGYALKTQEITEQLNTHSDTDKLHSEQLKARAEIDMLHEEQIKLQAETDKKLAEKLQEQEEVDRIHAEELKIQEATDKKLEKLIKTQAEKIKNSEEQISVLFNKSDELREQIEKNYETIKEQESKMNSMKDEINKLNVVLDTKANNTLLKITLSLAGLSFGISVIACFI